MPTRPERQPSQKRSGRDNPRGRSSGPARSRDTNSQGSRPSKGGKRIPPPPIVPDTVTVERVDDRSSQKSPKNAGKASGDKAAKRRGIDVSDVAMNGVAPATAKKLRRRLAEAAAAFEAERFGESEKMLRSIQQLAPGVAEVHELMGLTHYRMGRWIKAIREFEAFYELTRSVEQHPVWADCCRALKRWAKAEELWHELGDASPGPELIEEGRIVQAGALADRGRVVDAIRFLERAPKVKGKPGLHHLRRWYVLGDLYERAGDNSRSRRIFADIAKAQPDFGDAAERATGH